MTSLTDEVFVEALFATDRAWFTANPKATRRLREYIPGEFSPTPSPWPALPGFKLAVEVTLAADFGKNGSLRLRKLVTMPASTSLHPCPAIAPTGGTA
jgi:hypothetical protein